MRMRILSGAAALALTGCAVLASFGSASAQWYDDGWRPGWQYNPAAFAADVIDGTVAAATSPLWAPGYYDYAGYSYGPAYVAPRYYDYASGYAAPRYYDYAPGYAAPRYYDYAPGYAYTTPAAPAYTAPGTEVVQGGGYDRVASCEARFKTYNPATGTYTGYDGRQHPC